MLILLLLIFVGNENVHQTQMIEQTPHLLSVYYSNLRYLVKNYAPYIYLLASRKNNLLLKITYHEKEKYLFLNHSLYQFPKSHKEKLLEKNLSLHKTLNYHILPNHNLLFLLQYCINKESDLHLIYHFRPFHVKTGF